MVAVGKIVKEDCSEESKARIGTIVKVTEMQMHKDSHWQSEVERWMQNFSDEDPVDMIMCDVIRPGKVVSIRWQDNPQKETIHVFYDDCNGRSHFNYSSNCVEVVGSLP